MCTSNILTDSCLTKQKTKTKNTFVNIVYSVLAVKKFWYNIKKFVWKKKMVNKLKIKKWFYWIQQLFQTNTSSI